MTTDEFYTEHVQRNPAGQETLVENQGVEMKEARWLAQADRVVRENPVPAIITAISVGFIFGVLVRSMRREPHPVRDYLEETGHFWQAVLAPVGSKARDAYSASAGAVRGVVEKVVEKAAEKLHESEAKTAPSWWQRF